MECRDIISASADYIEQHLRDALSVDLLAARAGFSPYYFCRLFTLYMGMSVMEYIRRRRLACAAWELCEGRRILDVALDYGFESHNGFSKAFRKVYGCAPDEYRRRVGTHRPPATNPLAHLADQGGRFLPDFRIEKRSGFYIAGMVLRTSQELTSIAQQPALFSRIQVDEVDNQVYAKACPEEHGEYYISFPVKTGLFRLVTGVKVDNLENVDSSLYVDWVPPALCGIFSPPPTFGDKMQFAENIIRTWKYIFAQWLPNSGYVLDANGLDYEFYDERCHGDGPYSMDICVPLVQKEHTWP